MYTYSVRTLENAEREFYIHLDSYFVSILDEDTSRVPQFSRKIPESHWHIIRLNSESRNVDKIWKQIDALIEWKKTIPEGSHIVVHCSMGMVRSPALAIALLISDGLTPLEAFDSLKNQKPLNNCSDCDPEPDFIILETIDCYFELSGNLCLSTFDYDFSRR